MSEDYVTKTVNAYNASRDKYVDSTSEMVLYSEIDTLIDLLPDTASPILDAGCAYGRDCEVLAGKNLKPIGIDMSDKLLEHARKLHSDINFLKMDVRHLAFSDDYFSGVWCNAVLLHLIDKDIHKALSEFHRVLKPEGAICISFKEGEGEKDVVETFSSDQTRFYNFKTLQSVAEFLQEEGFLLQKQYILNERERFGEDKRDLNWIYCFAIKNN